MKHQYKYAALAAAMMLAWGTAARRARHRTEGAERVLAVVELGTT